MRLGWGFSLIEIYYFFCSILIIISCILVRDLRNGIAQEKLSFFFPAFCRDLEIKSPFERSRLPLQTVWMEDIEDKKRCCTVFENKRFQILRRQQLFNDIDNRKTRWKRKNSIRNQ